MASVPIVNAPDAPVEPLNVPLIFGPNITGGFYDQTTTVSAYGAFKDEGDQSGIAGASGGDLTSNHVTFRANRENSLYGSDTTVSPASFTAQYLIRY